MLYGDDEFWSMPDEDGNGLGRWTCGGVIRESYSWLESLVECTCKPLWGKLFRLNEIGRDT